MEKFCNKVRNSLVLFVRKLAAQFDVDISTPCTPFVVDVSCTGSATLWDNFDLCLTETKSYKKVSVW